jgi:cobalt-zinc-cadmium efflux system outer membrane protein
MMVHLIAIRRLWVSGAGLGCLLVWMGLSANPAPAQLPPPGPEPLPAVLTRASAVAWGLQNNPKLAVQRQQRGIAAAAVVIAQTYPFNPIAENRAQGNGGPTSAGIDNRVALEHLILQEVEIRGQRGYRREVAAAALSRVEWDIADQEQTLAIRVLRAFNTVLYRREKIRLLNEIIGLTETTVRQVEAMLKTRKLLPSDLISAQTEVDNARALLRTGRTLLVPAEFELRSALGIVDELLALQGALETQPREWDPALLLQAAFDLRPDLKARQSAVAEADAKVKLQIADRFGNPIIGPAFTYDPTRVHEIGGQVNFPIPVFNTRRGEIEQRKAERMGAELDLRQTEVLIREEVQGALFRLQAARALVVAYQTEVIPNLTAAESRMRDQFNLGQATVLQIIDVRRKLLTARDVYLDALYELSQAQADLAAAVGDPVLAITP